MGSKRTGIKTLLNQCLHDMTYLTSQDTQDLARLCGRLERMTERLQEDQPVIGELAYVLYRSVERVLLDPPETEEPIAEIRRGMQMLKDLSLALDGTAFDRSLFSDLARFSKQMNAVPAGGVDESDSVSPEVDADAAGDVARVGDDGDETEFLEMDDDEVDDHDETVFLEMDKSDVDEEAPEVVEDSEALEDSSDEDFDDDEWAMVLASQNEEREKEDLDQTEESLEWAGVEDSMDETQDAKDDIQTLIETLSISIMTVGLDDLSGLGQILTKLESLQNLYDDRFPTSLALAEKITQAINGLVLDEYGAVDDPMSVITSGIALLQSKYTEFLRVGQEGLQNEDVERLIGCMCGEGGVVEGFDEPDVDQETLEMPISESVSVNFEMDTEILLDFVSEAEEHLASAESLLLVLEKTPEDAETLNAVFRAFHTLKGGAGFLNLDDIVRVAHVMEDILDEARKGIRRLDGGALDLVFESVDLLKTLTVGIQVRLEGGQVPATDITSFLNKATVVTGTGESPEASPAEARTNVPSQEPTPPKSQALQRDQHYVRVGTDKLDQLVNQVGELVIAQTQVSQNPDILTTSNQKLSKDISQLVKISNDIQEIAMSMRMVPIKPTFDRMARLVRDLSRKCQKDVVFKMAGEDTELDKNVVEEIVDPLTHMIRNAIDHGLESPNERKATGKSAHGTVSLEAYHKGGSIVIELKEDGRGLDREKILKKALERGLAKPGADYSDDEIANFIFQAGFSTADKISDVSGRGVGMDVVRRSIEGLRGKVEVHSEKGLGTTFLIRLPLTLAIIDGMVIGVGGERYILPMTSIVRSLQPSEEEIHTVMDKGEMIKVQDELFPLVRLYKRFDVTPAHIHPWEGLVVVVEAEEGRCCVLVDELIGMQQVVIKGLSEDLREEPCLSGCAILGDGQVGLILDAHVLVQSCQNNKVGWHEAYRSAS